MLFRAGGYHGEGREHKGMRGLHFFHREARPIPKMPRGSGYRPERIVAVGFIPKRKADRLFWVSFSANGLITGGAAPIGGFVR
jgi:hypothetical protein